jgi:hypothetical protein
MLGDAPDEDDTDAPPMPSEDSEYNYEYKDDGSVVVTDDDGNIVNVLQPGVKSLSGYLSSWAESDDPIQAAKDSMPTFEAGDDYEAYLEDLKAWQAAYDVVLDQEYGAIYETSESEYGDAIQGEDVFAGALDYSESLVPGIDAEQKQEIFDNLDNQYAQKLQAAMLGLDRQAAMMGTFGSGAHMMSLNTAVAQVLTEMADQYNEVEMLDVELQKTGEQDKIANAIQLGASIEGSKDHKLNMGLKLLEVVVTPFGDWITANLDPNDPNTQKMRAYLFDVSGQLFNDLLKQGKTVEQALFELSEKVTTYFNTLGAYPDVLETL